MNKDKIHITEKFDIEKEYSFKQALVKRLNSKYGLNIKNEYREKKQDEIRG